MRPWTYLFLGFFAACLAGCASPGDMEAVENNDPFEPFNRAVSSFNDRVDENLALPIARAYARIFPEGVRNSIHGFIYNTQLPITFANDLLQLAPLKASQTLARFAVNTTIGVGGLFDPATRFMIPDHQEDFGQTLGFYGVGEGPYLVLPFLGPAPPRDIAGRIADIFFDPLTYSGLREATWWGAGREAADLIDLRARNIDSLAALRTGSLDFYATIRSIYRQYRNAEIQNSSGTPEDLPNF
jgi:phospholipid-binding lipoprotein MlaA